MSGGKKECDGDGEVNSLVLNKNYRSTVAVIEQLKNPYPEGMRWLNGKIIPKLVLIWIQDVYGDESWRWELVYNEERRLSDYSIR